LPDAMDNVQTGDAGRKAPADAVEKCGNGRDAANGRKNSHADGVHGNVLDGRRRWHECRALAARARLRRCWVLGRRRRWLGVLFGAGATPA